MQSPGQILLNARESKGLTLDQAGKKLGIAATTIHSWERGVCVPRARKREKVAKFYGIPEEMLMEQTSSVNKQNAIIAASYETRPIMMHKKYWAEANALIADMGAADLSDLFVKLISDTKIRKKI